MSTQWNDLDLRNMRRPVEMFISKLLSMQRMTSHRKLCLDDLDDHYLRFPILSWNHIPQNLSLLPVIRLVS
jgi:hypothetical protein